LRFFWLFLFLFCCCYGSFAQQHQAGKQSIFEVTQADAYARYRYIDNQAGTVTSDDLQYRFTVRPKIKIPNVGMYFGSRIETGSSFSSSWSNSGIGISSREWVLNAKTFFVGKRLGSHSEVEIGAMDVEQGAGTEATYTDLDAYTEGYRLRLHNLERPHWPSKILVHIGYLGDFNQVNAFSRLYRLGGVNYVQVLTEKNIEKWAVTSLQFDRLSELNLLRGAVKFNLPDGYLVSEARLELVGRMNKDAAAGWALHLTKTKGSIGKINPGFYYSELPPEVYAVGTRQALLNGDVYGLGKRLGVTGKYQVTRSFEVSALITRRVDNLPGFRWRAQMVGRYQFASMLKGLP
jgi:hypothetical protein